MIVISKTTSLIKSISFSVLNNKSDKMNEKRKESHTTNFSLGFSVVQRLRTPICLDIEN